DRIAAIDVLDDGGQEVRVLPSTGAVLGLQIHGRVRAGSELLSPIGVTGIQTAARRYAYVGPTRSLLVRFTPQGACCLGVPASELANRSVDLGDLVSRARMCEVSERLAEAPTVSARVAIVEQVLRGLSWTSDPLIERALAWLDEMPVAEVAQAPSLQRRSLRRSPQTLA